MSKRSIRFTDGDIWECSVCGNWNISGRACKCGRTLGDQLAEKYGKEKKTEPKKDRKKSAEPVSRGEFIESYLYRNNTEEQK